MSLKKLKEYFVEIRAEIMPPVAAIEENPPQEQGSEACPGAVRQDKMQISDYMKVLSDTSQAVVEDVTKTNKLAAAVIEAYVARKAEQTEGEVSKVDDGW